MLPIVIATMTADPATLSKSAPEGGSSSANRRRDVGVPAIAHYTLPGRAYDLWVEGRLLEELGIPDDKRTRVEIIGGEIFVSPGPLLHHAGIIADIRDALALMRSNDRDYPWRSVEHMDFNLRHIGDGYIPDLIILTNIFLSDPSNAGARHLVAEQIGMVVEVTSKSTASNDREPIEVTERRTKWNGYAHEGVEFYLLVDREPNTALVTLFAKPDLPDGEYRSYRQWAFGETIALPEPFGVEISTENWLPREK